MSFDSRYFSSDFDLAEIVSEPIPIRSPSRLWPPRLRQIPFTKRLIILGLIRRPFIQEGRITGKVRRFFVDDVAFSATAVKRFEESVSMSGFIVTDDILDHDWEILFESREKESVEDEEELIG